MGVLDHIVLGGGIKVEKEKLLILYRTLYACIEYIFDGIMPMLKGWVVRMLSHDVGNDVFKNFKCR